MIKSAEIFGLNILFLNSIIKKCFFSFNIHFFNIFPQKAETLSREGEM